jgi:transcriptional regulator with XRE-family HTH domain
VGELTGEVRRMLTQMRQALGMSQEDVGARMNPPVTKHAISDLERSGGNMTIYIMEQWSGAVGMRPRITFDFVQDEEEPS